MGALSALSDLLAGLALLGFVGALIWLLTRPRARMAVLMPAPGRLTIAAAAMALWCAALYLSGAGSPPTLAAQALRDLAILGWLAGTFRTAAAPTSQALRLIQRLLAALCLAMLAGGAAAWLHDGGTAAAWLKPTLTIVAMVVASGGLLLIDGGARHAGGRMRMPTLAVAGGFAMLWAYELNIQLIGTLTGQRASTLIALVPAVALLILPTFVIAAMDIGRERMRLSRPAAMRAVLLVGGAAYLILIALAGAVARLVGGDYGELAQSLFLLVALGAGGLLFASARARAWLSVTISKHFFEHRYDYRSEWMRFTATLAQVEEGGSSLHRRVAKALAELTGSPAALLMLPDAQGGFHVAEHWGWPVAIDEDARLPLRTAFMLQETQHIVDLEAVRHGRADDAEALAMPDWLIADARAWVVVPLLHFQRMIAVAVLHRPPALRALDWEDFDVLRIAGQQAASYLAESQSQQALSEARRFDEFNRRFAFIMHDIKNLASQLSLLARNAERHADKPAFRADMVETLTISAGRLSDLLTRLAPRERARAASVERVLVEPILTDVAAGLRPRGDLFVGCDAGLAARGDGAAIAQIVEQLAANALDASPQGATVQLVAASEQGRVRIDVIDRGAGMSRAFIRDELFKPFVSTKEGGFGLGAFEALQIAQAMGGMIDVSSEPGEGSRFTLWLPLAGGAAADEAIGAMMTKVATR